MTLEEGKTGSADSLRPSLRLQEDIDGTVYSAVYRVLLAGMLASTLLYVIGVVRALEHPQYFPLDAEAMRKYYSLPVILSGFRHLDPMVLMMAATLLLVITPILRVIVSLWAFAVERDGRFCAISGTVLVIIAATLMLGWLGLK